MGNLIAKSIPESPRDWDIESGAPSVTAASSSIAYINTGTSVVTVGDVIIAAKFSLPPMVYGSLPDPTSSDEESLADISTNLTTRQFDEAVDVPMIGLDDSVDGVSTFVKEVYDGEDMWPTLSARDKAKWCFLILRRFPQSIEKVTGLATRNLVLKRHFASEEELNNEGTAGTQNPYVQRAKRLDRVVTKGGDQVELRSDGSIDRTVIILKSYKAFLACVPAWKIPKSTLYNGARPVPMTPPMPCVRFQHSYSPVCTILCIAHMVFFKNFNKNEVINGCIMNILRIMREGYGDFEIYNFVTRGEGRHVHDLLLKILRQWNPGKSLTALTVFHKLTSLAKKKPTEACDIILQEIRDCGPGFVGIDNFKELENTETFSYDGKWGDDNVTACDQSRRHCLSVQGARVNTKDKVMLWVQDFASHRQFFEIGLELIASMPNAGDEIMLHIDPSATIDINKSGLLPDDCDYYDAIASCGPSPSDTSAMEFLKGESVPEMCLPIMEAQPAAQTPITNTRNMEHLFSKIENVGFFLESDLL